MDKMPNDISTSMISDIVQVKQQGIRSIQLEKDMTNPAMLDGYVLTAQALSSLGRIINGLNHQNPARAWTITGPYGSGKSYLGLYLLNLTNKFQPSNTQASGQLNKVDPILAEELNSVLDFSYSSGLFPLPITGSRTHLSKCIQEGALASLSPLVKHNEIMLLVDQLTSWQIPTRSRDIISWLEQLIATITTPEFGYSGILMIFDEMGKPLEYSATYPETEDVFLLQEIGEFANRSSDTPFVYIGILHQAFERYASLLDHTTQREWAKVQGRFEDIAYQETAHQQMRLLGKAIEYLKPEIVEQYEGIIQKDTYSAIDSGWSPAMLSTDEFLKLSKQTYPLHPTTLVALPYVFQRLAQNERSIFAYLASLEPLGFQDFIKAHKPPSFIRLPDLFDYLFANFQARLYSSGRARILIEAAERLGSSPELTELEVNLLKTIGLLNWMGESSSLRASEQYLKSALKSGENGESQLQKALEHLQELSLIVSRRFNQTYAIWQGSDVDIDERLREAQQKINRTFSLAEELETHLPPRPLIARRHSYQSGTMRIFEMKYVDLVTYQQISLELTRGSSGLVVLCLPLQQSEVQTFIKWAQSPINAQNSNIVIGVAGHILRLSELLYELQCLHWVRRNTPALRDDRVARLELQTRIAAIENLIQQQLDQALSLHRLSNSSGCQWYYEGQPVSTGSRQSLSNLLSIISGRLYSDTPRIWNELINRQKLTSQGSAARRQLIELMLTNPDLPLLGIEGYPPERSMYASLLDTGGVHRENHPEMWQFNPPPKADPLNLRPTWNAISDYIFEHPPEPRPVELLIEKLLAPPFGLTEGVIPVILCAFTIVHEREVTLYKEGTLLPEPGVPDWEVLLRRPDLFSIAGVRITGPRALILERFAQGLNVEAAAMPVVRMLIRQLKALPDYSWRTNELPATTIAVRQAIDQARSPEQLLFSDLPVALGMKPFRIKGVRTKRIEEYFERLNQALDDLIHAAPRLQSWARDEFLKACGISPGEDGWNHFLSVAQDMTARVTHPNLLPLLKRATDSDDSQHALDSVLAFVSNRPMRSWSDDDKERFSIQAGHLGTLFKHEQEMGTQGIQLNKKQRARSEQIAKELFENLGGEYQDDPNVVRAALNLLLKKFHSEGISDE